MCWLGSFAASIPRPKALGISWMRPVHACASRAIASNLSLRRYTSPVGRRMLNFLAGASLAVCLLAAALCIRSYWVQDRLYYADARGDECLTSNRGYLEVLLVWSGTRRNNRDWGTSYYYPATSCFCSKIFWLRPSAASAAPGLLVLFVAKRFSFRRLV